MQTPNALMSTAFTHPGQAERDLLALDGYERELTSGYVAYSRGDFSAARDAAIHVDEAIALSVGKGAKEADAAQPALPESEGEPTPPSSSKTPSPVVADIAGGADDDCYSGDIFRIRVGAGMLMATSALYSGSTGLWRRGCDLVASAPEYGSFDADERSLWLAAVGSALYDDSRFPEWFRMGSFGHIPADAYPLARFFYAKHLYVAVKDDASSVSAVSGKQLSAKTQAMLSTFPNAVEPLVSQTQLEGVYVAELYLRLVCAIAYSFTGDHERCADHIERAIDLALPDGFVAPLAEYAGRLGHALFDRLEKRDWEAFAKVRDLAVLLGRHWAPLHNELLGRSISDALTLREIEVASLAVLGLSNSQIAERLRLSVSTVKQALSRALRKTGAKSRRDLGKYL